MPRYEVRRLTVLASTFVEARNETEARTKARDVFVREAQLAALAADVSLMPLPEPYDWGQDQRSEARYEYTKADAASERMDDLLHGPTMPFESAS